MGPNRCNQLVGRARAGQSAGHDLEWAPVALDAAHRRSFVQEPLSDAYKPGVCTMCVEDRQRRPGPTVEEFGDQPAPRMDQP